MLKRAKQPLELLWAAIFILFVQYVQGFIGQVATAGSLASATVRATTTLTLNFQIGTMAADEYALLTFPNARSYFGASGPVT